MCSLLMTLFSGILLFSRPVHDWEVELISSFLNLLYFLGFSMEENLEKEECYTYFQVFTL